MPYVCLLILGCGNSPQQPSKKLPFSQFPGAQGMSAECAPGALGCPCDVTGGCAGGAFCNHDRICAQPASGCTPGEAECSCAGGSCNSGLACVSGVCHDNTGLPGGPCLAGSHCHTAARCAGDVCVQCSPGEQGCTCSAGGLCNETLACRDGMCVAGTGYAAAPAAVTAAVCVTPCSGGMVAPDGTWVNCPADGVMDGCLPGLACDHGQCLCSGSQPTTCTADVDCPDFHTCLDGYCRANCAADGDCQAGAVCHRRVCRKSCDIGTPTCPNGNICQPLDGQKGVCLMKADSLVDAGSAAAVLTLSTGRLRFGPGNNLSQLIITNGSPFDSSVVLRKAEERHPGAQTLALLEREIAPAVDAKACTTGTLGCRCSMSAANPCVALTPSYSLVCESQLCKLPTCAGGTEGCACTNGDCRKLCEPGRCPLEWVSFDISIDGTAAQSGVKDTVVDFLLPAGKSATVTVGSATQSTPWDGVLEVEPSGAGASRQTISLTYANTPDGSWAGSAFYFGDFLVNSNGLGAWEGQRATLGSDPAADTLVKGIGNAFLQEWANFRRGKIDYHTFSSVLTSTRTGSWSSPQLAARCGSGSICFPDDSLAGFQVYTQSPNDSPVPGGVVELPFGMSLGAVNKTFYQGAVDSTQALHYPGSPAIALGFSSDPGNCTPGADGNCIAFINSLQMTSAIGGRYNTPSSGSCVPPFAQVTFPWLVPGFAGASVADSSGNRQVHECRNGGLSAANPLLDGSARSRTLSLIDGAVINGDTMLILFSESLNSAVSAYGIIVLKRKSAAQSGSAASPPPQPAQPTGVAPDVTCKGALLVLDPLASKMGLGNTATLLATAKANQGKATTLWPQIVRGLLTGSIVDEVANPPPTMNKDNLWALGQEQVHYLCEDTRQFETGGECPVGSRVTYFTVNVTSLPNLQVEGNACQSDGSCDAVLKKWIAQGGQILDGQPSWRCADGTSSCSDDNFELRKGKNFYPVDSSSVYLPIANAVDEAFRYRTRFVNRAGTNVGFAPDVCDGDPSKLYCYSPDQIVLLEQRYNCLIDLYLNPDAEVDIKADTTRDALQNTLQKQLVAALSTSFSDASATQLGFERLRAELLVMLGDDAYVRALSSRFDLAGLGIANFPGSQLEPGGIDLSGVAGAEMFSLYQAAQYYQLAIDRLSALMGPLWQIVLRQDGIVGQAAAVGSISRVIDASSQKAEVQNAIASHYQNFDRADLARQVISRGYIAAYLESMELTTLIKNVANSSSGASVTQIQNAIDAAQLTYSAALQAMSQRYASINQAVNYFGLPSDYIPFPALEGLPANTTAFDVEIQRANQIAAIAGQAEQTALSSTRSFDSDAVAFQNQLASIVNTYESQLADLCGTFSAGGVVYPAIAKYASLDPVAATWGDPCGRMGTGQLNDALLQIAAQQKTLQGDSVSMGNVLQQVEIERERISAACQTNADWAQAQITIQGKEISVQDEINGLNTAKDTVEASYNLAFNLAFVGGTLDAEADSVLAPAGVLAVAAETELEVFADDDQLTLQGLQDAQSNLQFKFQCNAQGTGLLQIDSAATVKNLLLQISALEVQASRDRYQLQQGISQAQQLANQASRTQAQLEQNLQMTINAAAAANDPNVRIYANDAVINADNSFNSALTEAYRATRVFEYYTGQTYAGRDKLYLVRMVNSGDVNLQQYLINLEAAFRSFQDDAGIPDTRVLVMSLRDDLMGIPFINECGEPVSTNQRVALLQRRLSDPSVLDANGYIVVPFRIGPELVSPLTINHKLQFVEAQIIGGRGDQIGRVYLRMAGASMVETPDLNFYTFPRRTGVINAFFSVKPPEIDPTVYRTYHFEDRPLMNSRWELVLNFKDEPANADFTINDVSDVRLYLYYSDFTQY